MKREISCRRSIDMGARCEPFVRTKLACSCTTTDTSGQISVNVAPSRNRCSSPMIAKSTSRFGSIIRSPRKSGRPQEQTGPLPDKHTGFARLRRAYRAWPECRGPAGRMSDAVANNAEPLGPSLTPQNCSRLAPTDAGVDFVARAIGIQFHRPASPRVVDVTASCRSLRLHQGKHEQPYE